MKSIILTAAAFLASVTWLSAQSDFIPKKLGAGVNSSYDEVNPVISADRSTLFFARKNHPQNALGTKKTADIWTSTRLADGSWQEATRSTSLNIGQRSYPLGISADGLSLLLYNDEGLSLATRQGSVWSAPQKVGVKASMEATLSADGKYILFSRGGTLYRIDRNAEGHWQKAQAVKGIAGKVYSPFMLSDNKTMYFSREIKGKQSDLFKVERISADWSAWSAPVALNDTINTTGNEEGLKTNANGAWGYFASTAEADEQTDILEVKLYEDRPYVLVTGKIINAKTKRPLTKKAITILVDGKQAAVSSVNADSATFRVELPLGARYELSAKLFQYGPKTYPVDAVGREFKRIRLDLEEEPVDFALLKGKLMVKNTERTIPASAKARIMVDGEEVDYAEVDVAKGTYSIRLPHGTVYYVQVSARGFESLPDLVDLKGVDGYEEITLDLQADAEKMAIVSGKIVDLRTAKPVGAEVPVQVVVEGVSSVTASVDSLTREYELRFPVKERYVLSAEAEGYYPLYESVDVTRETTDVSILRDLVIAPLQRGQSIPLNNITFNAGKVITVHPSSYRELDRLATFLLKNPRMKVEIGAYTDPGTKVSTLNQAKAVMNYLVEKEVPKNRVTAKGHGTARPIASNKTPEGRARNRRVEFLITEK